MSQSTHNTMVGVRSRAWSVKSQAKAGLAAPGGESLHTELSNSSCPAFPHAFQGNFWKSPRWKHPGCVRRQRSWSRTMNCSHRHLPLWPPLTTCPSSQVQGDPGLSSSFPGTPSSLNPQQGSAFLFRSPHLLHLPLGHRPSSQSCLGWDVRILLSPNGW